MYGSTSSPAWKRGRPLAPVVGEGQVNLVATGCSRMRAMVKVSKLCGTIDFDDDESNRSPVASPVATLAACRLRNSHGVYSGSVALLTSVEAGRRAGLKRLMVHDNT